MMAISWLIIGTVAGSGFIYLLRRYIGGRTCVSPNLLTGKTVIITGANCGIGKETACELAKRNARVILACRDLQRAHTAVEEIRKKTLMGELIVKQLDLASLSSVRQFSEDVLREEPRIDVLINNAAVFQCPYWKTVDGHEMQFGVNHLGHFLLTNLLLDCLKKSSPSRIVIVSSMLYKRGTMNFDDLNMEKVYNKARAYGNSKLANCLFAKELHSRLAGSGVDVLCTSPGMVLTNLGRHTFTPLTRALFTPLGWLLLKSPWQGAQSVVHCAVSDDVESGGFYRNCALYPWKEVACDSAVGKKLWEVSEGMTGLV